MVYERRYSRQCNLTGFLTGHCGEFWYHEWGHKLAALGPEVQARLRGFIYISLEQKSESRNALFRIRLFKLPLAVPMEKMMRQCNRL